MKKAAAISVRLDDKTIAGLDRVADLQGIARTSVIREAIAKHLQIQPPTARSGVSKLEMRSDDSRSS
jgi:predicted transcriptional regulator